MARLGINTGTSANDGTGDTLLAGAQKINSNFNDIYNYGGNGNDLNFTIWNNSARSDSIGISTTDKVGIGATSKSEYSLYVEGDQYINGNISVAGTITYDDVTSVDAIGIITARTGVHVLSNGINILGISTFASDIDLNASIDIDGHTELDNLNVSGVTTTSSVDINGDLDVDGHTELDDLNVSGVTTTSALLDINAGGQANTFKIEDLTSGRVVIVGSGGEIEDASTLTFSAGTLSATTFSGSGANLTNIPNTSLDNSSITLGGITVELGETDSTPSFDLTDAINYPYTSLTGVTTDIIGDTTPQLGGNLDLNSNNITGVGNISITGSNNITGISTAGSFVGDGSTLSGIVTSIVAGSNVTLTGGPTGIVTINSAAGYTDSEVDTHLNTSGASSGQILSWNGSDYAWVEDQTADPGSLPGISTTTISYFNHINAVGIITAQDFDALSDISLKTNIETVNNPLLTINDIRGVKFEWKASGKNSYGVIAQELEHVLPELVGEGEFKTVNYNGIIGVLIEAVKGLNLKTQQLESEIKNLKQNNQSK